jgi:HK97 family phage prohead protease
MATAAVSASEIQVGPLTLRALVDPKSVNAEKRTANLVFSTGARVLRNGWDGPYYEELSLDKKAVRMARLNNGAPLLNAHGGIFGPMLEDQIGVVESARLEDGKITGTVRFARAADDPKADQAFRKVQDGIIRNVSVGYRVYRMEKVTQGEGQIPVFRATDWEAFEVSLVPLGADDGAKVRGEASAETNACQIVEGVTTRSEPGPSKESTMSDETRSETIALPDPLAPPPPPPKPPEPTEVELAVKRETERVQGILTGCRAARLPQSYADGLIGDTKVTLQEAQTRILKELALRGGDDRGPQPGPQVRVTGEDPLVHVRAGIENAVLHRWMPPGPDGKGGFKLEDIGRQYRGMSMLRIAEAYLMARGVRTTHLSKMELAGLALGLDTRGGMHTTSDFALLLADAANKTLRQAYAEAPQTFTLIGRRVTLPDFKPSNRLQIGDAPALLEVKEHGEFQRGTITEGKEVFQLLTYGRIFAITRKALVNDDTDAFSRVATMFGRSARALESDLAWTQITSNPTMGDGIALFHASHGNLAASGTAISVDTLGVARAAMRVQKGLDGTTLLNINPRYLLLPAAKETLAAQFLTQITPALPASVNPFAGVLTPIVEPRLDVNSTTAWYMAASSDQIDILEYAFLEGEEGPMTENRIGFDIDGLEIKARHDFAAKVVDHRGLYKNPGA